MILAPADIERLAAAMARPADTAMVLLLGYSGLRPGEAWILRWRDLTGRGISVTRALSLGGARRPKNGRTRLVPYLGPLRSDLLQHRMAVGGAGPDDLLFPSFRGGEHHVSEHDRRAWVGRRFRPGALAAGLPIHTRPYDLRASNATLLLKGGFSIAEVSRRLGHSPATSFEHYQGIIDGWEGGPVDLEAEILRARGA